jgi:hypothetical protein
MWELKGLVLFEKLAELDNYDHLSERDQYEISLMEKNIQQAVYKYVIHQWETWAADRILEGNQELEEPKWNARSITEEVVKQYTNDILPEKVMRYYEAYIYNSSRYRGSWIWARHEFGGLKDDKYYVIM